MKVLELFAGSRSLGKVAESMGCEVFSSDIKDYDGINYVVDVRDFDPDTLPFKPDIIWASPPCTTFSVAACWRYWKGPSSHRIPASYKVYDNLALVQRTLEIIEHFKPKFWFIENPRGMLRHQALMKPYQRHTISYCSYGDWRMKPTDIWTNSQVFIPRTMCSPRMACQSSSAGKHKNGGVSSQSTAFERSKIPKALCREIIQSCLIDPSNH